MSGFLQRLVLFGLLVLVLDLPFRWAIGVLPYKEYDDRLRRVLNDSLDADIVVFGSSRGARDVIPERITAITGRSAFGLGYPGASLEWQEFVLQQLLRGTHKPRTLLLVVDDPAEIIAMPKVNFRLDRAYPLVTYPVVHEEVCARTGRSPLFGQVLASYRVKDAVDNLWDPPQPDLFDTVAADGSMTSALKALGMDTATFQDRARAYPLRRESAELRTAFQDIAQACHQHKVQLVLVHPPDLRTPNEDFVRRMRELAGPAAITYRYDTTETRYRDRRYYYDRLHLNREGAGIFSDELGRFLATSPPAR